LCQGGFPLNSSLFAGQLEVPLRFFFLSSPWSLEQIFSLQFATEPRHPAPYHLLMFFSPFPQVSRSLSREVLNSTATRRFFLTFALPPQPYLVPPPPSFLDDSIDYGRRFSDHRTISFFYSAAIFLFFFQLNTKLAANQYRRWSQSVLNYAESLVYEDIALPPLP